MTDGDGGPVVELSGVLVRSLPRWGLEFREPAPRRPSPLRGSEPVWYEPAPPYVPPPGWGLKPLSRVVRDPYGRWTAVAAVAIVLAVLVGVLTLSRGGGLLILAAGCVLVGWLVSRVVEFRDHHDVMAAFHARRDAEVTAFRRDWGAWKEAVDVWDAGEFALQSGTDLWYPLTTRGRSADVFGGRPRGWAALLVSGLTRNLADGRSLLTLDLSEHRVDRELREVCETVGAAVRTVTLPAGVASAHPLAGLGPEAVTLALTDAVGSRREAPDPGLDALNRAVLTAITRRLGERLTFRRISAALQVLRRSFDPRETPAVLSDTEIAALATLVDTVAQGERAQHAILLLASDLELLVEPRDAGLREPAALPWPAGLTSVRVEDRNPLRAKLTGAVLVQSLIHRLRDVADAPDHLVVLGADDLGSPTLQALAGLSERSGIRKTTFFRYLRGAATVMTGASGNTGIFMHLGPADEARAAAEFIGRGHRFVFSELTRTASESFTRAESSGLSGSSSVSRGRSWSDAWVDSVPDSWSNSTSRSLGWSRSVEESHGLNLGEGETESRVYEFAVEPTQLQSMEETDFLLVDVQAGVRRVVAGDCNPGIGLLPRVSGTPAPGDGPG